MYPLLLEPAYQHYVWGGDRIPRTFHRPLPPGRYAESWEVSDRIEAESHIANGLWKGLSLSELLSQQGDSLLGQGRQTAHFPLLVKIIDAKENLSVQVHPNDTIAPLLDAEAKTEMWVALERSWVYAGLKPGTTAASLQQAIQTNCVETLLEKVVLEPGEMILIPGGTVHAICAGSFLLEIQQNSNTTYRLYDWGRQGRALHLKEGFLSIEWNGAAPQKTQSNQAISSPYFIVAPLSVADSYTIQGTPAACQILFCKQGKGAINSELFSAGQTYLIPACLPQVAIQGPSEWIQIIPPV